MRISTIMRVAALGLVSSSCATAPKQFQFDPIATMDAGYEDVWSSVVEYFAVGGLPIAALEKDSGIIATSWMDAAASMGENKTYCDCGGAGLTIPKWTRGKFNVLARRLDDGRTQLRVTAMYQQQREFMDARTTVNCNSTGYLEKSIHDYVRSKIGATVAPSIPTFSPSSTE